MKSESLIIAIFISVLLSSCHSDNKTHSDIRKPGKDDMAELNRYLVQKDREVIESYSDRKGLKMTESPTGLWYQIKKEGTGNLFKEDDKVLMTFECDLLDGTKCYSSDESGPKEVIIGKSQIEQGLNEGLKLLRPGGEAVFIIPPHLGYGLLGDGAKIPPRTITIYYVTVSKIN